MRFLIGLSLLFLACCGNNKAPTWGEAVEEFSVGYCHAINACGWIANEHDGAICEEHTAWHLCAPDGTCDLESTPEQREALDACMTALADPVFTWDRETGQLSPECLQLVFWGILPAECGPFFDSFPEPSL